MKKQLLLFLLMLLPLVVNADSVEIDGIYYNIITQNVNYAEVAFNPNKYTGNITIPESVTYNHAEYSVTSIGNEAFQLYRSNKFWWFYGRLQHL